MRLGRVFGLFVGLALVLGGVAAVRERHARQAFAREIRSGNWRVVRAHLERGRDPNTQSLNGTTPIMLAAEAGDLVYLRKLLDGGAKIDNSFGKSALTWAAGAGQDAAVDLLLDRGALVEISATSWLEGPRQAAFAGGHKALHQKLVRRERLSGTLLGLCENPSVSNPLRGRIEALLDRGAIVNGYDINGTALRWVAARGDLDAARLLLERHANPTLQVWGMIMAQPLDEAVSKENIEMVRLLLRYGCDPNEAGLGMSPLMQAAYLGNKTILQDLIAAGADVNEELGVGQTALTFARERKHAEIVRMLQAAGAR